MGAPKKASSKGFHTPANQSAGILDDHAVRKNVASREGTFKKLRIGNLGTYGGIFDDGWYTYYTGDNIGDKGCDIALPHTSEEDIYIGYGQDANDKTFFGSSGIVTLTHIDGEGNLQVGRNFTIQGTGTLASVPTVNNHIVNKKFVDDMLALYALKANTEIITGTWNFNEDLTLASGKKLIFSGGNHYINQELWFNIDGSISLIAGGATSNINIGAGKDVIFSIGSGKFKLPAATTIEFGDASHYITKTTWINNNASITIGAFGASSDANWVAQRDAVIGSGRDVSLNPTGDLKVNGLVGWSGTFTNGDAATVTVTKGIITNVV